MALKVVKLGMDTAQVLARFNNELQAIRRLTFQRPEGYTTALDIARQLRS